MQNKHILTGIILVFSSAAALSQTTYTPLWAKENWFLQRLEIKAQKNPDLNLSTVKPYMRKAYVAVADSFRTLLNEGQNPAQLSKIDQYNLNRYQSNNKEYSAFNLPEWKSKKPFLKVFYPTPGNFIEVNSKDFYLSVNPVLGLQLSKEKDFEDPLYVNTKGATFRGLIAKKVAFDFYLTDNQERGPLQYRQFIAKTNAVPGAGFWKTFKTGGYDYFDARGSINSNVTKYINVQFGYDKNFIGNGYRSMFLSDASNNALFFKINTRIWKLNYTNLYMELFPTITKRSERLLDKKYATMHHLGINVTRWLNIGLFESVIFGRPNRFDFSYLLPVIFLRSIEQQNGSPDNANIGIDFKVNVAKKVQVYGQLMLDELNIKELRKDKTWWANKTGIQLGAKYVDAFGINNLDLQVEWNRIRPFTYSHYDSIASYTHYNQPLAHPMGANLNEYIGILRYQPLKKLYITAKLIAYKQGLDSTGLTVNNSNFGSNPSRTYYDGRTREYGFNMLDGVLATTLNASAVVSYELIENLFIEGSGVIRKYKVNNVASNTSMFTIGLRWNMFRREYDY